MFSNQYNGSYYFTFIGFIILSIGVILVIIGVKTLGNYFTTSINPKGLVTRGIYSKFHHPMFIGAILVYLGIDLIFESIYGFFLVFIVLIPFYIYSAIEEEKRLLLKFKERYQEYKKKTIF